jgi:hypothetical protein
VCTSHEQMEDGQFLRTLVGFGRFWSVCVLTSALHCLVSCVVANLSCKQGQNPTWISLFIKMEFAAFITNVHHAFSGWGYDDDDLVELMDEGVHYYCKEEGLDTIEDNEDEETQDEENEEPQDEKNKEKFEESSLLQALTQVYDALKDVIIESMYAHTYTSIHQREHNHCLSKHSLTPNTMHSY